MKKGLCIVLSALIVACSFSACSKKGGKEDLIETKVDKDGRAVVVVTKEDGKAVTNADTGEEVTSVLSDKEVKEIEKVSKANEKDSKVNDKTKGKPSDGKNEGSKTNTQSDNGFDSFDPGKLVASDKDLYKEGTKTENTSLFKKNVQDIIKTGKFTIDMNITSSGQKSPMKLAFDGNKMYASFKAQGIEAGILYMDKTAYILMPSLKYYIEYPDEAGEFTEMFDSIGQISENGGKYVGSTKVTENGKTYTCEEYKTDDGTVLKYYFDANNWKRYECISDDEKMVYEINSFSGTVDSNLFSLKGYKKMDEKLFNGFGM